MKRHFECGPLDLDSPPTKKIRRQRSINEKRQTIFIAHENFPNGGSIEFDINILKRTSDFFKSRLEADKTSNRIKIERKISSLLMQFIISAFQNKTNIDYSSLTIQDLIHLEYEFNYFGMKTSPVRKEILRKSVDKTLLIEKNEGIDYDQLLNILENSIGKMKKHQFKQKCTKLKKYFRSTIWNKLENGVTLEFDSHDRFFKRFNFCFKKNFDIHLILNYFMEANGENDITANIYEPSEESYSLTYEFNFSNNLKQMTEMLETSLHTNFQDIHQFYKEINVLLYSDVDSIQIFRI